MYNLTSGLTSGSTRSYIYSIQVGATLRNGNNTLSAQPGVGAELLLPKLDQGPHTQRDLSSLTPCPPLALSSPGIFPDQLWPQAWPGSPLCLEQGTGNGPRQGVPSGAQVLQLHPSPPSWPEHLRPMCALSQPGLWVPCFMAS